jgi:hypothetical protein
MKALPMDALFGFLHACYDKAFIMHQILFFRLPNSRSHIRMISQNQIRCEPFFLKKMFFVIINQGD